MIGSDAVVARLRQRGLEARWRGEPPDQFGSLTADSRRVGPGDLFCAVAGRQSDGHAFLADASLGGAAAAVVEHPDESLDLPQLVVSNSRAALAGLAMLWSGDPGAGMRLIGITGTNGKTTTAWLARHLLGGLAPSASLGTLGIVDPEGRDHPGELTTPDPLVLADALRTLEEAGARLLALEVSSHALDQRRVDGLLFDYAVFTSFGREHLDYHEEMHSYREAKLRMRELLTEGGALVVNADEPAWGELLEGPEEVVTTGLSAEADVRAEGIEVGPTRTDFRLAGRYGTSAVELPLIGRFNVENALSAAAVGLHMGMSAGDVAERLACLPQVPGRFEILRRSPFLVVRDYAHTPDAFRLALAALRPLVPGKLIMVFGCGGDRDRGKRPLMGEVAAAHADRVIVTSDNPRSEDPARIAEEVVAGMSQGDDEIILDRKAAIERALRLAGPGDAVFLAGKGHETYQIIGDRKLAFDEAAIVAEVRG